MLDQDQEGVGFYWRHRNRLDPAASRTALGACDGLPAPLDRRRREPIVQRPQRRQYLVQTRALRRSVYAHRLVQYPKLNRRPLHRRRLYLFATPLGSLLSFGPRSPMNFTDSALSERPVSPDDGDFPFRVYGASRAEEMAAWGWPPAQQESFLRMQFRARAQSYAAAYPDAAYSVLLYDGAAAGTAVVWRGGSEFRLVDIALLPEFRNRGLGTFWISRLIREAEAATVPLRLHVFHGNRAAELYRRLGFVAKSNGGMYVEMERDYVRPE
jgi:GNAT superfamily N-acetyltransferase